VKKQDFSSRITRSVVDFMVFRWLLLLLFIALGVAYAAVTPVFEAPDEGAHFLYIHNLLESGELPVMGGRRETFESRSVQRHHPPLYYLGGALLVGWVDRSDVDSYFVDNPFAAIGFVTDNNRNIYLHDPQPPAGGTHIAVWILRLYSLTLASGTLLLVYRAGEIAFPGRPVGLLAMAFLVSLPGFVAGAASINNDNLVTFLFAAGITLTLDIWRRGAVTRRDLLWLSLILGASTISKQTGLALPPLVYAGLGWAALRHRLPWRDVWRVVGVTLAAMALLGGWWYVRNIQIYGDPLALERTLSIWGRGSAVSRTWSAILFEAKGVWDSFWMTLGHFNIRGPEWLYGYVPVLVVLGVVGLVPAWLRQRGRGRDAILLMLAVVGLMIAALAVATRQINVSQGRILYPMMIGFAPLLVLGWRSLLGRWLAPLLLAPLLALTVIVPFGYLARAYTGLERLEALPADAVTVTAEAEGLRLEGYRLLTPVVAPGELVELLVYFRGLHPENPTFFVQALDPITQDTLGGVDLYPGMAPTSALADGPLYGAHVVFRLDEDAAGRPPMQLRLALGWRVLEPEPAPGRYLEWVDANGAPVGLLTVEGPVLVDPTLPVPQAAQTTDVRFGEGIRLLGYTLPDTAEAGGTLPVGLVWDAVGPISGDYTLTVGLVNAEGELVAQADDPIPGYPTDVWVSGRPFHSERMLPLPDHLPAGTYTVYIGWYSTPDIVRLPVTGDGARDNLLYLPMSVEVD
jgi:hypothetical protein